jgi:hypothetical protein
MPEATSFQLAWLKKLEGATLRMVYLEQGCGWFEDNHYPVLVFQGRNRKLIYAVLKADPEGNGPGWLDLTDRKGKIWGWPRTNTPQ